MGLLENGLFTIVGLLVGYGIARFYSERSSKELAAETARLSRELVDEAAKLRRLCNILARALEEAGWGKFTRDEDGNVQGNALEREMGGNQIAATGELELKVNRAPRPPVE